MKGVLWLLLAGLLGCQQQQESVTNTPPPTAPADSVRPTAAVVATPPVEARPSARLLYGPLAATADTTLPARQGRYHLHWSVRLDTLQTISYRSTGHDTTLAIGFQGYYTFEVRDSTGQVLGRRTLTKPAFYRVVGQELAVVSGAFLPTLLGYSKPLGGLVFTVDFNAPETDWSTAAVLLLTLEGKVRRLSEGYSIGGPAVQPTLSGDGRTLLTGSEIVRAAGAALPLQRPGAELQAALLLNDTLAVTMYQGTARSLSQPNAFVLNTRTGQFAGRFRYNGFWEELGVTVPWYYLTATRTGYFLDDKKGLYLLSAAAPEQVGFRPFKTLTPFEPPLKPNEKQISLAGYFRHYQFYIDTLDASRIRYSYEQVALE